tara:strand:+ start:2166 stop:2468 length:303 start_codon:yes stop_codon:yes gene_type:complete
MIDIETDTVNQHCKIKSDKMVSEIYVEKEDSNYSFFKVRFEKGILPSELSGRYSSLQKGKEAVEHYLRDKVKTKTVQRNEYADQREMERNASKSKSESSQ